MNGNPEMGRELSPNDQAIEAAKNPEATSYLDSDPDLALSEKAENRTEDGKLRSVEINDDNNELKYQKNIAYKKVDDPERPGKMKETDEVKAITEKLINKRDDQGRITQEQGKNLDNYKTGHEYAKTFEYDDENNTQTEKGEVTGGENKGEQWEKTISKEQKGEYTKQVETNTIKKPKKDGKEGEFEEFETTEVKYIGKDEQGKDIHVYGYHISTDGKKTMEWGKKPADLVE